MTVQDGVKEDPDPSANVEADRNEVQHFRDWRHVKNESDA